MNFHIRSSLATGAASGRQRFPLIVIALLFSLAAAAPLQAFELSQQTYKRVVKARKYIAEDNLPKAEELLLRQRENVQGRKFDLLEVLRTLGYLYAQQEKNAKAVEVFEEAVAIKDLPLEISRDVRYNLAQMYMVAGDFGKAAAQIEQYLKDTAQLKEKPRPSVYMALASAYSQEEQYAKVIEPAKKGIALSEKPRESWYQLLLAAHFELKQFNEASKVLQELVVLFPDKKQYWNQLSSIYLQLGKDAEALAVYEVMYRRDLFDKEQDFLKLANFLSYRNNPERAARVLSESLNAGTITKTSEHYRKLANFWRQARELDQAISAYEAALKLEKDAATQIALGYVLLQEEEYEKLIELADNLAADAGDKEKARALLFKGQALYSLDRSAEALDVMRQAARIKEAESEARGWVSFLSSAQ